MHPMEAKRRACSGFQQSAALHHEQSVLWAGFHHPQAAKLCQQYAAEDYASMWKRLAAIIGVTP